MCSHWESHGVCLCLLGSKVKTNEAVQMAIAFLYPLCVHVSNDLDTNHTVP